MSLEPMAKQISKKVGKMTERLMMRVRYLE